MMVSLRGGCMDEVEGEEGEEGEKRW